MHPAPAIPEAAQAWLDLAACGLLRTDAQGRFLVVNRTFCGWVGQVAAELVGHKRLQDFFTVGGRIFHQTHWLPLLQMQNSISEVKFDLVLPDGQKLPVVMNALRRIEEGAVVHDVAVFVARDRDKYEKELLRTGQALEAVASEARRLEDDARDRAVFAEQMVGIVSHDLRNPLSTIQMSATLLAHGPLDARQQRVVDRIASATRRATRLIGELLDLTQARIGSGLTVNSQPIDLHKAIADSVEELAVAFPDRKLLHEVSGEGLCSCDADRMAQMVGNLVGNAITYGSPDSVITIRSSVEADSCHVSVHNAGEPIPEGRHASLFKPMTRGGARGDERSLGMGLYIVSEIAKAHSGTVRVDSTAAEGTTFTFTSPRG